MHIDYNSVFSTFLLQVFMILPLAVIYILANITFQMAVKNSSDDINCTTCWNYTEHLSHIKYFNAFKLIKWYYNPALWVLVLCFGQAMSHMFERKCICIPIQLIFQTVFNKHTTKTLSQPSFKVHVTPQFFFHLINSMYIE